MTKIIFTLCSNNYLAQALVLAESARKHQPGHQFIIGLTDLKQDDIDYNAFDCPVLEAAAIEPFIKPLAEKYSIIELNTCVKPSFFLYFFSELQAGEVIYLDPDIRIYSPFTTLEEAFNDHDILLTPHILTPIPLDERTPDEPLFLNYGIYNLGFLALKKTEQVLSFLAWWKDRTYQKGYDNPARGLFTDQIWINLVPVFYERVYILRHAGYNMAPWNLHERILHEENGQYHVNTGMPLVFYHFSGFDPARQKIHKNYSRFEMDQRPDLVNLYEGYRQQLTEKKYRDYKTIPCHYVAVRQDYLRAQEQLKKEEESVRYQQLPLFHKLLRQVKRNMPSGFKKIALKLIQS